MSLGEPQERLDAVRPVVRAIRPVVAIHLLRAPESLANVLDAAGLSPLERCGAILDDRVAAREGKK